MPLSHNVQRVQPSVTMQISAKAAQMKRDGVDVIALSAGEPDFDTPQNIKDAGIHAIEEGFTKYTTPGSGIIELKEAICRKFDRDNGLVYNTDEVIVNSGAKHSLFLAVAALINPGDEVIIPTPYWVTYCEQPLLVGGEPVIVETRVENGLKLTPDEFRQAITPRTRTLLLNSPTNPTGVVFRPESLRELTALGIPVISDEIYADLTYGSRPQSILEFTEEAIAAREALDPLDNYAERCEPGGMPRIMRNPHPFEFVDHGSEISLASELYDLVRTIHMGSAPPPDAPASPLGYSTGRWEGNTLIVTTTRINWPYFDNIGTPQSEVVEMLETFTVSDDQTRLDYRLRITDPGTFAEPAIFERFWLALGERVELYDCTVY